MKILYITKGDHVDYQNDCLLIGLKEHFGPDVVDINKQEHNYETYDEEKAKKLYGMGFSVTRVLADLPCDRTDITAKIKNKFFDYIIYGSIWRCSDHIHEILKYYPPEKIIAVDGEDEIHFHPLYTTGIQYFKRELVPVNDTWGKNVKPISFAIPTCKVNLNKKILKKSIAFIDPMDRNTYIYKNETDYYNDYFDSMFGITTKKAGWDCMRHYEIISQGCIPYFPLLANCPMHIMVNFPKQECKKIWDTMTAAKFTPSFDNCRNIYDQYITIFDKFLNEYGTTKGMARDFLKRI